MGTPITVGELRELLAPLDAGELVVADFLTDDARICRCVEGARFSPLFVGGYDVVRLQLSDTDLQRGPKRSEKI